MIGKRIRVEYFDQNYRLEPILPRSGVIERQLASESVDDWFLLRLDEPFDYQIAIDQFNFRGIHNTHLLIRSRWHDSRIGDLEPTSVFILLIPDSKSLEESPIHIESFHHVAWGMAHTL